MDQEVLDAIVAFVEGRTTPAEFSERVYGDPALETLLTEHEPSANRATPRIQLLRRLDWKNPSHIPTAETQLVLWLRGNSIPHTRTHAREELANVISDAEPDWLCATGRYVADYILPGADGRTGEDLRSWLHDQLLARFRYAQAPPDWLQTPDWPIGKNGPLVFLGQVEIPDYFHDAAAAYVFYNANTEKCDTIMQVA